MVQALDTFTQEEMRGGIEGEPEHHVECIDFLSLVDLRDENLGVLLENVNVAQTVFDKLRPDELAGVVP